MGPISWVRISCRAESALSRGADVSVVTSDKSIEGGMSCRRVRRRGLRSGEFIISINSLFLPVVRRAEGGKYAARRVDWGIISCILFPVFGTGVRPWLSFCEGAPLHRERESRQSSIHNSPCEL